MNPHTSKDYDGLLRQAHGQVTQMGVRVERQLADSIESLSSGSAGLIDQILRHETVVNALERSIDALAGQIIARRQPAANDLRLLMALLNATTDLERIGDEAKKIALQARHIYSGGRPVLPRFAEVQRMAGIVLGMVRHAVQSLDALDPQAAAAVASRDADADAAFRGLMRQLISFMIEDPRTISACLDLLLVAKSLERVGDHATNVSEHVYYARTGTDVRHASPKEKSVIR
jgi:phosphate transport system protein